MGSLRNPNDYRLIATDGVDIEKGIHGHKHLFRLIPECKTPDGFHDINFIYGKSVIDDNGRLMPQFMALHRHRVKGYI